MKQEDELHKCEKCNSKEGTVDLHSCPSDLNIHSDDTPTCNCCQYCVQQCCDDI